MGRDRRGFEYALEPVRNVTEWEMNDLVRELASLNANVDQQHRRTKQLAQDFSTARAEVIAQLQNQALLDIDRQRRAHAFMAQVQQQLTSENEKLHHMCRERDEAHERLNETRKFADSLDRNKETEGEAYDQEIAKQAYREADDAWLQRLHWRNNS